MPDFRQAVKFNGVAPQGLVLSTLAKTGAYTLGANDGLVTANATTAAFTITLPTAVGIAGRQYTVKKIDSSANAVTVGTTSAQTIDGATTYALSRQFQYLQVVSDGSNWQVTDSVTLIDQTATDIQQLGTQAAGASGLAADGKHVHPASCANLFTIGGTGLSVPSAGAGVTTGETVSSTSLITVASLTVPGGEPAADCVYEVELWGLYGTASTNTNLTFAVNWGSTALGSNAFTMPASQSLTAPSRFRFKGSVYFTSATICYPNLRLELASSNSANTAVAVYVFGNNATAGITVTTSSAQAFAMTMQWTTNSASNGFYITGGRIWKAA